MKEGLRVVEDRGRILVSGMRKLVNFFLKSNELGKFVKNNCFRVLEIE